MYELIILFMLFACNVLASLFNTGLCIYFSVADKRYRLDDLLCNISFVFSLVVIVCDALFCTYILLLK